MATELYENLINVDSEAGRSAWRTFLFNVYQARLLKTIISEDRAQAIFQAGSVWNGEGLNSTNASKTLYQLTWIPLVSGDFCHYRDCWLYAVAVHLDVASQVTLQDHVAAAAFALSEACDGGVGGMEVEEEVSSSEGEDAEEAAPFEWEDVKNALPDDLAALWKRYGKKRTNFDVKAFLDNVPKYREVPQKPAENNYAWCARAGRTDKAYKVAQQVLLHLLRVQAAAYDRALSGKTTAAEKDRCGFRGGVPH